MKRKRPFKSRLRNSFLAIAGASVFGGTGVVTELLPKNPQTDTQIVFDRGTPEQSGINISYLDQFWKRTLSLQSDSDRAADMIAAARAGDNWRVAAVLEHHPDLATDGVKALAAASEDGHRDVIAVLLHAGVSAGGLDDLAFMTAMRHGQLLLADQYMTLAMPSVSHLEDALIMAAGYGDAELLGRIMERGILGNIRDNAALIAAAEHGNAGVLNRLLIETITYTTTERIALPAAAPPIDGDYLDEWDGSMRNYPHWYKQHMQDLNGAPAYETRHVLHVKTLVDVQAQDNLALKLAVQNGHFEAVKILIANGADIADPAIALAAVDRGDNVMVDYILDQTPMVVDVTAKTPLYQGDKTLRLQRPDGRFLP